jgi:hypothetical protein
VSYSSCQIGSSASHCMQGTARRWEVVTACVRTRTMEEVLEMVKHGKMFKYGPKQDGFTVAKKRQQNTVIHSEASTRIEAFSDVDVHLSGGSYPSARPKCLWWRC